jgi:hypothetical protein
VLGGVDAPPAAGGMSERAVEAMEDLAETNKKLTKATEDLAKKRERPDRDGGRERRGGGQGDDGPGIDTAVDKNRAVNQFSAPGKLGNVLGEGGGGGAEEALAVLA